MGLGTLMYILSLSIHGQWSKYNFRGGETEAQKSWLAQIYIATEVVNQCMLGAPSTE